MDTSTKQMKAVWMIVERGDKSFWTRIGVGFVNRDGSLTLSLEAMPCVPGAKIQVRDLTPRDADDDSPSGDGSGLDRRGGAQGSRDDGRQSSRGRENQARRDPRASEAAP